MWRLPKAALSPSVPLRAHLTGGPASPTTTTTVRPSHLCRIRICTARVCSARSAQWNGRHCIQLVSACVRACGSERRVGGCLVYLYYGLFHIDAPRPCAAVLLVRVTCYSYYSSSCARLHGAFQLGIILRTSRAARASSRPDQCIGPFLVARSRFSHEAHGSMIIVCRRDINSIPSSRTRRWW